MRVKRQFWLHLILIISLIISTTTLMGQVAAQNPTKLSVLFPNGTSSSINEYLPSDTFDVYIYIEEVTDLYGFDFRLNYNTAVLTANSITLGDFFPGDSVEYMNQINNTEGYVRYIVGMPLGTPKGGGMNGTGALAIIAFTVDDLGVTTLDLVKTKLSDSYAVPIDHDVYDGFFTNISPVANFTYSPIDPYLGQAVTFDASLSASNPNTNAPIINYAWDFGDGATGTGETTTHTFTAYNNYTVTLNITDSEGQSAIATDTVRVYPRPPVASFDYSPKLPQVLVTVTFDASTSYDPDVTIVSYAWDFGDSNTGSGVTTTHAYLYEGVYTVKLTVVDDAGLNSTTEKSVTVGSGTIEIEADVGTIHFIGEKAEFYLLVKFLGNPIDATEINAKLYHDGTIVSNFPTKVEHVDTGLYRILWDPIPDTASPGTYTALIQANYFTLKDSTIKSFLISKTLTEWNPLLISIEGTVGTIKTDVGLIKLNLKDINATLTETIIDSNGEILAKIDSAVGTITAKLDDINATLTEIIIDNQGDILAKIDSAIGSATTSLDAINAKVVAIDGNVATIKTDVGTIKTNVDTVKTTVSDVQTSATTPLYVTSIFSAVAAIIALIVLFILRKKPT